MNIGLAHSVIAVGNIGGDGSREKDAFLGYIAQFAVKRMLAHLPHIHAVHKDLALGHIIKTGIRFTTVDLPQPVLPMMAVVSPGRAVKSMS